MKAVIKIVTARKEFRQDQLAIMKRVALVLIEHDLSVDIRIVKQVTMDIEIDQKITKEFKLFNQITNLKANKKAG